jgi:hypothetical protein
LLIQFVPHGGGGRVSRRRHLVYERSLRAVTAHVGTLPVSRAPILRLYQLLALWRRVDRGAGRLLCP